MTRREARTKAMQVLYTMELGDMERNDALNAITEGVGNDDVMGFLNLYYGNEVKIDAIITTALTNYSINRLNAVDRAIIRIATAELLSNVDKRIVIDEALEITKEYSDQGDNKQVSFNNRLLENISKLI